MSTPAAPILFDFYIDPKDRKRKMLYGKRPTAEPIPVGAAWRCICGDVKAITPDAEQFCSKCGCRFRLQENAVPEHDYGTTVIVGHFPYPGRRRK
jgi:hypothetical protein